LNFQKDGKVTPGEIFVSGLKGAMFGELARFAVSPNGVRYIKGVARHLESYGSAEVKELQTGWLKTTNLPFKGNGMAQLQIDAVEGALKWPLVAMVMQAATPVWDTGFGAIEKGADYGWGLVIGNKSLTNQRIVGWDNLKVQDSAGRVYNVSSLFRQGDDVHGYQPFSYANFFSQDNLRQWLASAKHGKFTSPLIKVFMRQPSDAILSKSTGAIMRKIDGKYFWNRAINAKESFMNGLRTAGNIPAMITAESIDLAFVAGTVTGIERGLKVIERAGLYWDTA
jgi:hypothetical protein